MDKKDPSVMNHPARVVVIEGRPFTIIGDDVLEQYQCLVQDFENLTTKFQTSQEFYTYNIQELETIIQELKCQCVGFEVYDEFVIAYKYSTPETHPFIISLQKMQIRAYEKLNELHKIELMKLQEKANEKDRALTEIKEQHELSKEASSKSIPRAEKLKVNKKKSPRKDTFDLSHDDSNQAKNICGAQVCNPEKSPIRKGKVTLQSKANKVPKITHCLYCDKTDHLIYKCDQFANAQLRVKLTVVSDKKLCFRCLNGNHFAIDCKVRFFCNINSCHKRQKRHHRLLHTDNIGKSYLSHLIAQGIGSDFTNSE